MVGVRQEHARQFVEADHAVGFWIGNLSRLCCRLQRRVIRLAMLQRAEKRKTEQLVGPHIDRRQRYSDNGTEFRPNTLNIAYTIESFADVTRPPGLAEFDACIA